MVEGTRIKIRLENCKSIENGEILISENVLNIKYAINGTGKSTIAEALECISDESGTKLNELKTFGSNADPKVEIFLANEIGEEIHGESIFNKVIVFNEEFVKNTVFKEDDAIDNSFEVFIKTSDFEKKMDVLNQRLKVLNIDIGQNTTVIEMQQVFRDIQSKIKFNENDSLRKQGMGKDIIKKYNSYNLPEELIKYSDFFQSENRVDWVDWKTKGSKFDDKNKCPFCANELLDVYAKEKETFEKTYNKSMIKNQKDLEDYLTTLKPYINDVDYKRLYGFTRNIDNENDFQDELKRFCDEAASVSRKIDDVVHFNSYELEKEDLNELSRRIKGIFIVEESLKYFNSDVSKDVFDFINGKIGNILSEVSIIKTEMKELNNHIINAIESSCDDINRFLETAGINYEISIYQTGENEAKTRLRYIGKNGDTFEVQKLRKSLSWGERNSIALILFMYYALQQDPYLIILDDPVSSFDKNKKFAIVSRLFNNKQEKNLCGSTVLLLTHDLEPIIDLRTKHYFDNKSAIGYHVFNNNGILKETEICSDDDIRPITIMYLEDSKNKNLNIINRITSLRKFLEYIHSDYINNYAYNILASLIKRRSEPTFKNEKIKLCPDQIEEGLVEIRAFIEDFDYDLILNTCINSEYIRDAYINESNNYLKVQLFRQYYLIDEESKKNMKNNHVLKKFIDESYHIENDYTHCLDYRKHDIVPPYIMKNIENFMLT